MVDPRPTPIAVTRALGTVGDHVRTWRKLNHLTIDQVAARANVSPDTVARLEAGRGASLGKTLTILRVLGILDQVVTAVDPMSTDVGRLRADQQLPQRVRNKRSTRVPTP